jgi:hypothetical protein
VLASASSYQRATAPGRVGWVVDHADDVDLVEWGGAAGMSFFLSFHLALLGLSEAYWLDDAPDLSCKDSTRQHPTDGCPLSCNR